MTTEDDSQRMYLRRILALGAERLGVVLTDDSEAQTVFGWRDRTIGVPVLRDGEKLWLRATGEHKDWATGEDWQGNQDAATLSGIPKPTLIGRVTWQEEVVVNCAELMTFVPEMACSRTPELRDEFHAPESWWRQLRHVLDVLGQQPTTRGAENPGRYHPYLRVFFGARADHLKPAWRTEHMDVQWSNLTAPRLWVLDWESWGRAPAGYGAASLYCHSLLVPQTARKVHQVFADILDSPEGGYAQLCVISHLLKRALGGDYRDLVLSLHDLADRILEEDR